MKKLTALFLALTMLLSLSSFVFAAPGKTVNYVSFGDSTSMGFYLDDYQDTIQHLNTELSNSSSRFSDYAQFKANLEKAGNTVIGSDLSITGTRPSELRAILDPTYYEAFAKEGKSFCHQHLHYWSGTSDDGYGSYENLHQTFTEKVQTADIITYNVLMSDFGLYFIDRLSGLLSGTSTGYQSTPENETYLKLLRSEENCDEVADSAEALLAKLDGFLIQFGLNPSSDSLIGKLLDLILYTYAHFAINFSASVDLIYQLNPDVELIVVGPHNPISRLTVDYNGIEISIGRIWDIVCEAITSYVVNEDPHADQYIFADCSGGVNSYTDDFADGHFADEEYASYRTLFLEELAEYIPAVSAASSSDLSQLSQNIQSVCNAFPLKVEDILTVLQSGQSVYSQDLEDTLLYGIDGHTASPTSLGQAAAFYAILSYASGAGSHPGASGCLQKAQYIWQAHERSIAAEHNDLIRLSSLVRTVIYSMMGDQISSDALQTLFTRVFSPVIRIRSLFR